MTKILIIRHGESKANLLGLFLGQGNMDLTQKGREQAKRTAEYLKDVHVDEIYSSDLDRAVQTAEYTAKIKNLPVHVEKGLREIDGGEWDFVPFCELPKKYPKEYTLWLENVGRAKCTGGESFEETQKRVYSAYEKIARENTGKTVAVFCHGTAIQAFITAVKGVSLDEVRTVPYATNASVSTLSFDGEKFSLIEYSKDDFLVGLVTALPEGLV